MIEDTNYEERTALTDRAHALALASVRAEWGTVARRVPPGHDPDWQRGGELGLYACGYWTVVFGQSSAGGHGKQGLRPERVASLREFARVSREPVRLVFVDQGGAKWQAVWLDINEPRTVWVDTAAGHKRRGWMVKDMIRGEGLIPFPDEPPVAEARAQETLI